MVCKNCGATVKEGQFSCSSCGTYLTKETTTNADSLTSRQALVGASDLYSHKQPVIINDGWKWYTFVTWGLVPLYALSGVLELPEYFKVSFILGVLALGYVILGCVTFSKLQNFTASSIYLLYTFLAMPAVLLLLSCMAVINIMRGKYGNDLGIGLIDLLKQGKIIRNFIGYGIVLVVNIIYFGNRKEEFKY